MADLAFGATAMASIFAIVDPLGVVPFFSVLTEDVSAVQKQDIVSKACLTATITLGVFAVFGQWDLRGVRLHDPGLQDRGRRPPVRGGPRDAEWRTVPVRLTPHEREETLQREEVSSCRSASPCSQGPAPSRPS